MKNQFNDRELSESTAIVARSTQPLSVLSLCETANGGVGRYQENLIALSAFGISTFVLLPESDRGIIGDNCNLFFYSRSGRNIPSLIRFVFAFLKQRGSLRPDVYFFNSTFSLIPLFILRLLRDRTPAIYCAHCWAVAAVNPASWRGRIIRTVEGRLSGLADLVVNVSEGEAAIARRFSYRGDHVVVAQAVHPPVSDARKNLFIRQNKTDVHLLFVGRFDRQKGLDILLSAFVRARASNKNLHLHLVGGAVRGGDIPELTDGVVNHGWAKRHEVDGFYRSADAVIVPSRWEGMPLVVLEAMRNGTPVFASTGCGMGDFLSRHGCGLEFDGSRETLVNVLAGLNAADLAEMRSRTFETFEQHFSLGRFTKEMAGYIRHLTKGGKK
ncbi:MULTISPECIES: glycosyltransferase family 4 protein [unclassified Sulfitobacter]|uniref:glycosyltransferase family 4 protein n=1 Tax=unclassified Sulfitobacter TaxID=196795 RepID=UPI00374702CE